MTESYRPSNGTEGMCFIDKWCAECVNDEHEDCPILAASFAYDEDDPRYPKEWVIEGGCAKCTAFKPYPNPDTRQPSVAVRDPLTRDMFS
jgi:hypothetical protein